MRHSPLLKTTQRSMVREIFLTFAELSEKRRVAAAIIQLTRECVM